MARAVLAGNGKTLRNAVIPNPVIPSPLLVILSPLAALRINSAKNPRIPLGVNCARNLALNRNNLGDSSSPAAPRNDRLDGFFRSLLNPVRFLTAVLIFSVASHAGCASSTERQAVKCSPNALAGVAASRRKEIRKFRQRVESGPFYKELVRRFGKPHSCKLGTADENITLSWVFRGNARLKAVTNPRIEFSEQRAELRGIDEKSAIALLKESEKDSFGRAGCGIDWNRAPEKLAGKRAGWREVVYRGDVCNCQARTVFEDDSMVALVSSSAC